VCHYRPWGGVLPRGGTCAMNSDDFRILLKSLNCGDIVEIATTYKVKQKDSYHSGQTDVRLCNREETTTLSSAWPLPEERELRLIRKATDLLIEPPRRSVVLDRYGDAWQRKSGSRWWQVSKYKYWEDLNAYYGPLRVVYTPEEAS